MKYLAFFNWQLKLPHYSIFIDEVNTILEADKRNSVTYLSCKGGSLLPCYPNKDENEKLCSLCFINNISANFIDTSRVTKLYLKFDNLNDEIKSFSYNSIASLKALTYENVNIGLGALSSYASATRNADPIFNSETRGLINKYLTNEVQLTDYFLKLFNNQKFDHVIIFNGRTSDTRPLYDICKNLNISFTVLELIDIDGEYRINKFNNSLPHDIEYNTRIINDLWSDVNQEKIDLAESFYLNRRNGIVVRDIRAYVKDQDPDLLPKNIDTTKKIISIFNSSEDEFLSIGSSWDSKKLFTTQNEGIEYILKFFNGQDDVQIVIRMHPNLSGLNFSFVTYVAELESKFENLIVVAPESKVSTYKLIEVSDVVISFGSSVGVEATFMEKVSISLGGSFYYYLDACYQPKNMEELNVLLNNNSLQPKCVENALKYSYFLMKRPYTLKSLKTSKMKLFNKSMTLFDNFKYKRFTAAYNILYKSIFG